MSTNKVTKYFQVFTPYPILILLGLSLVCVYAFWGTPLLHYKIKSHSMQADWETSLYDSDIITSVFNCRPGKYDHYLLSFFMEKAKQISGEINFKVNDHSAMILNIEKLLFPAKHLIVLDTRLFREKNNKVEIILSSPQKDVPLAWMPGLNHETCLTRINNNCDLSKEIGNQRGYYLIELSGMEKVTHREESAPPNWPQEAPYQWDKTVAKNHVSLQAISCALVAVSPL